MFNATIPTEENDEDVHMVKENFHSFQQIDVKLLKMVFKFQSLIEKVDILLSKKRLLFSIVEE